MVIALTLAVARAVTGLDIGPWVTSFALLAAVLGFYVEPWLETKGRRRGMLRDLVHEVFRNIQVLKDPKLESHDGSFIVYPRVSTTVVEATLSSGLFSSGSDEKLIKALHRWHESACEFNRRVSITEDSTASSSHEMRESFQRQLAEGRTLRGIRSQLKSLADCLMEDYVDESGIDSGTTLFGAAPEGAD